MRFSCHKAELLQAVQIASRVLPSQTSEPLFLNLMLSVEEGTLSVFATQHQVSLRRQLPVQMSEPGRVSVPGSLLAEILQQIQTSRAEGVDLTVDSERRIKVSSEGANYRLSGIDPEGFPQMKEPSAEKSFTVAGSILRDLIKRVVVVNSASAGASFDEVLLEVKDASLAFVATDSVRLAVARHAVAAGSPDVDVRLPLVSLAELGKILPSDSDVQVSIGSHQVGFSFAQTLYVARTSDKSFPAYRSILPKDHPRYVTLDARTFGDALKGVAPLARVNKHRVRFHVEPGRLRITSTSQEVGGEAERVVDADVKGEPIELSFNSKYILDFLGVADAEKVRMGVTAGSLPATFRPEGEERDYIYLLMPINL
ncbi:MAG: DNA polymerase III subunit beta [Candidatus Wallbacteria bacterium]|nr:DNA polymerase III subunit beta [Candidatus Wallbacteria bacterium]